MVTLGLVTATETSTAASRKQLTFVLVHGAWHGGWCWKNLAPLLRAAGHEVYAPTLTGMGERANQLTAEVGLNQHVDDVVQVLYFEDLRNVVLVGHSYGGMVISGVAEKAPERLAQLIYLDAFLPEDGKALRDYAMIPPARPDGWRIPTVTFPFTDPRIQAWAEARLTDQPIKTFTQPVQISPDRTRGLAKAYIQLTTGTPWFDNAAARARRNGFAFRSFLWNHEAALDQPAPLARIILELAG